MANYKTLPIFLAIKNSQNLNFLMANVYWHLSNNNTSFNGLPTLYRSIDIAVKVAIDAVPVRPPIKPYRRHTIKDTKLFKC